MKTTVYDKASWHIDAGETKTNVLSHFKFIMTWCHVNNLLNDEGEEVFEFGLDESISIHSWMLNERGNMFMAKFYDSFISAQIDQQQEMDKLLKTI